MKKWLKGIGIFAALLIALEVIAYVGLTLLGPTAFRDMVEILRPIGDPTPAIATQMDNGAQQKCSTYQGEIFCITDEAPPPTDSGAMQRESLTRAEPRGPRRCAEYQGQTICIEGDS